MWTRPLPHLEQKGNQNNQPGLAWKVNEPVRLNLVGTHLGTWTRQYINNWKTEISRPRCTSLRDAQQEPQQGSDSAPFSSVLGGELTPSYRPAIGRQRKYCCTCKLILSRHEIYVANKCFWTSGKKLGLKKMMFTLRFTIALPSR